MTVQQRTLMAFLENRYISYKLSMDAQGKWLVNIDMGDMPIMHRDDFFNLLDKLEDE